MADGKVGVPDDPNKNLKISQNTLCFSCKRGVKGDLKCQKCQVSYHPSCAVRLKGLRVISYEEVICPACVVKHDGEHLLSDITKENELLSKLVLVLMDNQELLRCRINDLETQVAENRNISDLTSNFKNGISDSSNLVGHGHGQSNQSNLNHNQSYASAASSRSATFDVNKNKASSFKDNGRAVTAVSSVSAVNAKMNSSKPKNIIPSASSQNTEQITIQQVSSAILESTSRAAMKDLQDLGDVDNQGQSHADENWIKPYNRRNRKFLVGDNTETADVRAITKFVSFHVTRLHPSTSADSLKSILLDQFPEVTVEPIKSKYPNNYASMKVNISQDNYKKAWRKDIWPKGAFVSKFFQKKGMPQSVVDPTAVA
ncbi:unnamed protein product [Phaedon cochleariae]|uniref:Zinc finger PHD-type domain-containing protein n=1 Tax=Phaedon cochleariae TaxID=80249 RepID=A0A9N9SB48_PHACE|nr:unnamed protein product [Phaedon cochleariae]